MAASAAAYGETPLTYDRVHLNGRASREVANDTLIAVLSAQREGQDAARLAGAVNEEMAWALAAAREVPGVVVQTLGYRTQPIYQNRRVSGWRVSQSLRLQSTDSTALTGLLGRLQQRLALQSIGYEVSPERLGEVREALVREALGAFRERAGLIVAELGADGYRLVELDVGGAEPEPRPVATMAMEVRAAADAPPPSLEAGTREVAVTATGTIELERGGGVGSR